MENDQIIDYCISYNCRANNIYLENETKRKMRKSAEIKSEDDELKTRDLSKRQICEYSPIFKYDYTQYIYHSVSAEYILQVQTVEQFVAKQYNKCFPDSKLNFLSLQNSIYLQRKYHSLKIPLIYCHCL